MRVTITTTVDYELKEKAMPIIQNELKTSIGRVLDDKFEEIIKKHSKDLKGGRKK